MQASSAGEELGLKADEKARAVEDLMSSEFTPQEQEQLRDLLGRLVEVLEG